MKHRNSGASAKDAPKPSWVKSAFSEGLKKKTTEISLVAAFSFAGVLFWSSWSYVTSWGREFVIQTTIDELQREKSRFFDPVKLTVERLRQSEIGALNVGSFTLTPASPAYTLPIYFPNGHAGQLSVMLHGNLVPKRSYVVLVLPNGKLQKIESPEVTIDLANYLRIAAGADAEVRDDLIQRSAHLKGLRTLTFQLSGPETESEMFQVASTPGQPSPGRPATSSLSQLGIHVQYVAFVAPAIHMSR